MDANRITETIIGAAIEVHRALGPGLLESAYQICLAYEIEKRGLKVDRQVEVPIVYDGKRLDAGFRLDLLVEQQVIVELKAKEKTTPVDEAQLLSYLKLMGLRVGLLINFHVMLLKDGIKRMVL